MILSDAEILSEVGAGRLVFDPELSENDNRLQSASVDLHLRNVFWRPQDLSKPGIHVTVDVSEASAYDYFRDCPRRQTSGSRFVRGSLRARTGSGALRVIVGSRTEARIVHTRLSTADTSCCHSSAHRQDLEGPAL